MIEASRVAIAAALVAFLTGSTLGLAIGVGWLTPLWRPAWFGTWGGLAWLANARFVVLGVEVLFRPRRRPVGAGRAA